MTDSRTAVISGGGTGIGAATAVALAATCTRLILVGRRPDRLAEVAASLATSHPSVQVDCRSVDLTDVASVEEFADWASESSIDILVSNAGSPQPRIEGGLASVASVWESTWRGNTLSAVLLIEALKASMARPGGRIIIVGSAASAFGTGSPAYAAAKGALDAYVITLMRELGSEGITANVVAPSYTAGTELLEGRISPERHERLIAGIAAGRPATPEEIASVIEFLASPGAAFVNGQFILANGGAYLSA